MTKFSECTAHGMCCTRAFILEMCIVDQRQPAVFDVMSLTLILVTTSSAEKRQNSVVGKYIEENSLAIHALTYLSTKVISDIRRGLNQCSERSI